MRGSSKECKCAAFAAAGVGLANIVAARKGLFVVKECAFSPVKGSVDGICAAEFANPSIEGRNWTDILEARAATLRGGGRGRLCE